MLRQVIASSCILEWYYAKAALPEFDWTNVSASCTLHPKKPSPCPPQRNTLNILLASGMARLCIPGNWMGAFCLEPALSVEPSLAHLSYPAWLSILIPCHIAPLLTVLNQQSHWGQSLWNLILTSWSTNSATRIYLGVSHEGAVNSHHIV